jgi:hypothetical protein
MSTLLDTNFIAEGYKLLRRDRDSKGGGILAYINTDFPVSRKANLESETLENISVDVHIYYAHIFDLSVLDCFKFVNVSLYICYSRF